MEDRSAPAVEHDRVRAQYQDVLGVGVVGVQVEAPRQAARAAGGGLEDLRVEGGVRGVEGGLGDVAGAGVEGAQQPLHGSGLGLGCDIGPGRRVDLAVAGVHRGGVSGAETETNSVALKGPNGRAVRSSAGESAPAATTTP